MKSMCGKFGISVGQVGINSESSWHQFGIMEVSLGSVWGKRNKVSGIYKGARKGEEGEFIGTPPKKKQSCPIWQFRGF